MNRNDLERQLIEWTLIPGGCRKVLELYATHLIQRGLMGTPGFTTADMIAAILELEFPANH